jgi:hypothetical protein
MATSIIRTIQDRIATLIEAIDDVHAAEIEVVREYKGDIGTMLAEALNKLGFGVVVALGEGERQSDEQEEYFERTAFVVTVVENPTTNSSGLKGVLVLEEILAALERKEVTAGNPQNLFHVWGHTPVDTGSKALDGHQLIVKCNAIFNFEE